MNHLRITMTEPFSFTIKVPMFAAEIASWVLGAAIVLTPVAAIAAAVTAQPNMITIPLPLPNIEPRAERFVTIDEKELDCLASNIYYEARNQSKIGQIAVGLVTRNRAEADRWASTICGVVHAPKQFSWTHDGKQNTKRFKDTMAYLWATHIASRILSGEFDNVRDMFQSDHYHTTAVRPGWSKHMERVAVIDSHIFYVDR